MKHFNSWLGDKLAFGLATMGCFYIITAFILIPLLWQTPHDLVGWVQYLVQSLFQGAALPVLGYVSRVAGERQERVLNETHLCVISELVLVQEELALAKEERADTKQLLVEIHKNTKGE